MRRTSIGPIDRSGPTPAHQRTTELSQNVAAIGTSQDTVVPAIARQRGLQFIGLFARFLENRGPPADMVINLARHRGAPPGDQPGQRQADNRGQGDNGRIGKQIAQKRFHGFRRIRPAQVEQDNR